MQQQSLQLSENARILFGYLNIRGGDSFGHVAERNGAYYVIPSPGFNWDSRIQIERERVKHPECLQELVDNGLLMFGEHPIGRLHADYSPNMANPVNGVYSLTDKGKEEGAKLLAAA